MGFGSGHRFALATLGVAAVVAALSFSGPIPASADVLPVNPVRVPLNGHPANSGFLVFVEGDVFINADEAEGTLALGGDLAFGTTYNVGAGSTPAPTFTAPGDSAPTFLYVGGGV
ncbi:MAG: collagen-binding domain-containing protein, partial [Microbacterium sp.]